MFFDLLGQYITALRKKILKMYYTKKENQVWNTRGWENGARMILIWHLQASTCIHTVSWEWERKLRHMWFVFLVTGVYSHANLTLRKIFFEVTSGSWLQTLVPVDCIQGVTVQWYSPPSLSWALWMFRVNFLGPSRSRLQSLLSLRGVLCTTPHRSTPANRDTRLEPFRRLRNHFSSYATSSDVRQITTSFTTLNQGYSSLLKLTFWKWRCFVQLHQISTYKLLEN